MPNSLAGGEQSPTEQPVVVRLTLDPDEQRRRPLVTLARIAGRLIQRFLFGVTPGDPATCAAAIAALGVSARCLRGAGAPADPRGSGQRPAE